MIRKIHKLLSDADVVVSYNGKKFDIPTLNKEFAKIGLAPPKPYKQIDLLQVVRGKFRLASNKLDYVSQFFGLGKKVSHSKGNDLFVRCTNPRDEEAWTIMEKYNKQDVVLLEKLYEKVLPWITNHPNRSVFDEATVCPACGKTHFQKRGIVVRTTGKYQQYQCNDCGHWFRGTKNLADKEVAKLVSIPL